MVRVGCIAIVEKDGLPRRAQILSIKETRSGRQFYCNFDNFNKRLDEWVPLARIDFDQEVEWPNPDKDKQKDGKTKKGSTTQNKKSQPPKKAQKKLGKREQSVASEGQTPHPWTEFVESQPQQKGTPTTESGDDKANASLEIGATPTIAPDEMEIDEDETPAGVAKKDRAPSFSREEEIEKLRTSGSMTQNPAEISRIRNISKVEFGRWVLFPWYFSPYPEVFVGRKFFL